MKTPASIWRVHILKTWPKYYRELVTERKHTEFRLHDRNFQVGDTLILREYDPDTKTYSGRFMLRRITGLSVPPQAPMYVILEIAGVQP